MPGGYMFGWDDTAGGWVKVQCDANGLLTVDSSLLFENPPTEDEADKGPSSEWAFDHDADVAAHHAKYTDVEARASINDIFGADGFADAEVNMAFHDLTNIKILTIRYYAGDDTPVHMVSITGEAVLRIYGFTGGVGSVAAEVQIYDGTDYQPAVHEGTFQTNLALFLEEAPSDAEVEKAPTSNWAYDHENDLVIHHTKYTDAEAQTACNLNGNLYWSIVGAAFGGLNPDTDTLTKSSVGYITADGDNISIIAGVDLPDNATVTGVIVYGNAAAEDKNWACYRIQLSDHAQAALAGAVVNTEDTTISVGTIDNGTYGYYLIVSQIDTNDEIYGARITYTL